MDGKVVPAKATVEELERKAQACEELARAEREPLASALLEESRRYRDWAAQLRNGKWIP